MLCFIVPLKSAKTAVDWPRVCELFEGTLRSAYQQTDPDLRVVAVCHERPNLQGSYDERVEFVEVDFPPPSQNQGQSAIADKWAKLHAGMVRAGDLHPDYFMFLDADDRVSNR